MSLLLFASVLGPHQNVTEQPATGLATCARLAPGRYFSKKKPRKHAEGTSAYSGHLRERKIEKIDRQPIMAMVRVVGAEILYHIWSERHTLDFSYLSSYFAK